MSSVASLRQIRRRIRSVENTKKITRAMEMVAASKLRRFQDLLESARPYTEKMESLLNQLVEELPPGLDHPFLWGKREKTMEVPVPEAAASVAVVLFTSDTGLCGTYNGDLEEAGRNFIREHPGKEISFIFVGKHGAGAFHGRKEQPLALFSDLRPSRIEAVLKGLREAVEQAFLGGPAGRVYALHNRMESLTRYHLSTELILPLRGHASQKQLGGDLSPEGTVPNIVEPDPKTVLDKLVPAFFEARLRFVFYHALLSEQIARMTAMQQATHNAEEMIDELTLLRNKARQAAITKEIIEVVSGSRAQKMK